MNRPFVTANLGAILPAVDSRLIALDRARVIARIWDGDHTVWKDDPTEITNRLGWLTIADEMARAAEDLEAFGRAIAAEGYVTAVLLGMGGSSLAPEVLGETFGVMPGALRIEVLDSTDPRQIRDLENRIDLQTTLFIVSSKSGGTIETRSQFAYFWEKIPDGKHFIVITDAGSAMDDLARELGVGRIFRNPPDIGGRYSALSLFGLVPAALLGIDVRALIARAQEMARACGREVSARDNPGAWLGAVMGEAALAGRDKVTLVFPDEIAPLGCWIEQLIAESTGKEGRGILPVEGEALGGPEVYGSDRLFVAIGDHSKLAALEAAGHPVVRLPHQPGDPMQVGAEFFRWEFATAVAAHVIGVNPFDQPNVQEAKDATARILEGTKVEPTTETIERVLATVRPGDYVAITAYIARNPETVAALTAVRQRIRDRYRVATTVGFGPRFLHSTGQLHKGGANNGVFLQLVTEDSQDLAIPGQTFTFGGLKEAQALGDLASLRAYGRRVWRGKMSQLVEGTV